MRPLEQVEKVQQQMVAQGTAPADGTPQDSSSARICFPFLNHGKCNHENCRFRHLPQDHPDAVADRMRTGAYDKIPTHANPMVDQNQNAKGGEPRICYTFLNRGSCDRPECTFRHLLAGHPDAVADRIKNGQSHKIPGYAKEALSRAPPGGGGMQQMQGGGMGGFGGGGAGAGGGMTPEMMAYWQYNSGMMGWDQNAVQQQQMMMMQQQQQQQQQPYGGQQQQSFGGQQQQPYGQQQAYGQQQQQGGSENNAAPPGETRICFPFLNRGSCDRGQACRFRHLTQDHPDAIADRMRTGRMPGGQPMGGGGMPGGGMAQGQEGMPSEQSYAGYGWQGASMPNNGV